MTVRMLFNPLYLLGETVVLATIVVIFSWGSPVRRRWGCGLAVWLLLSFGLVLVGFVVGGSKVIEVGIAAASFVIGAYLVSVFFGVSRPRRFGTTDLALAIGFLVALAILVGSIALLSQPACPGCPPH